ncbi:hypothetical protein [Sphingobium sp.]|uniref:hypothetical protein n=1 Tax=Sphingobium sp. TaxID=1912891 RepID=UPI003B3A908D
MAQWHERRVARIGLRAAGLALLVSAWMDGIWLQHVVAASLPGEASPAQILIAALMFASASVGFMLAVVGAGLWAPVAVSDRWMAASPIPVARDLESTLFAMKPTLDDGSPHGIPAAPRDGAMSSHRHIRWSPAARAHPAASRPGI